MRTGDNGTSPSAMHSESPLRALLLLAAAVFLAAPERSGGEELRDRVLAAVDGKPITLSEVVEAIALQPQISPPPRLAEAVETLIEARLMEAEARRYPMGPIPVDEIEVTLRSLRQRFPSDAAYRDTLLRLGIREDYLRKRIERELIVDRYLERRFRPLVQVPQRQIEEYYRTVLRPDLSDDAADIPPPEVAGLIRRTLEERDLNRRIGDWVNELQAESDTVRLELPDEPEN